MRAFHGVSLSEERNTQMIDRWKHQREELPHALDPARALFWSPRGGKTRAVVQQMQAQFAHGAARRFLIIAPKIVVQMGVWGEELERAGFAPYTYDLTVGKIEERKWALNQLREVPGSMDIVLVNWDVLNDATRSVKLKNGETKTYSVGLLKELLAWKPDVVIADEAHLAKSAGSARSRALQRFGKLARYRRILTGTPTPKNYVDLYAEYKFLAPSIYGTNKNKFLERYVETDDWGRVKFYRNMPELKAKMLSVASVFDRKTAWKDEPPQDVRRTFKLPPNVRDLYDTLAKKSVAEYDGVEIDGTHKLSRTTKFRQLTAGFVRDDAGNVQWLHMGKIDLVQEELVDLLGAGEKVVVFYHFTEEGRRIEEAIRDEYGAIVGRVGGDTPLGYRGRLAKSFTEPNGIRVMVMQDSLGIGISLKAASYVIRTSYPLDYAAYVQSNDRVYEAGKTLTYIEIEAQRTVDQWARRICTTKDVAQRTLLVNASMDEVLGTGKLNLELAA